MEENNNGLSDLSALAVIGNVEAGMVDLASDVTAEVVAEVHKEFFEVPEASPSLFDMDDAKAAMDSADLGASKPVPKPVYKARPVEHATVVACGHKLEAGHFPRNSNCEDCWFALFETTPEGVASVHQLLLTDGTRAVTAMHGAKFTKHFGRYLQSKLLGLHQQSGEQIAEGLQVLDINAERTA